MTSQRKRALVLASGAAVFLALFLWQASPMAWRPLVLAVGGFSLITFLLIAGIALQERSDAKHAARVAARNQAVEADPVARKQWERRMVASQ